MTTFILVAVLWYLLDKQAKQAKALQLLADQYDALVEDYVTYRNMED